MFSEPHPLTAQSTYHTILIAPKDLLSVPFFPTPHSCLGCVWGPLGCSEATRMPPYMFSALLPCGHMNGPLNRWGNWGSERLCGLIGGAVGVQQNAYSEPRLFDPRAMLTPLNTAPPCVSGCVKAKAGWTPPSSSVVAADSDPNEQAAPCSLTLVLHIYLQLFLYFQCIYRYIQFFSQNRQNLVLMISCFLLGYLGEHQPRSCLGKKQ